MTQLINKKWISCIAVVFALAVVSCKKSGTLVTATSGTPPNFSVDNTNVALSEPDSANHAITFVWSPSNFGAQVPQIYTLQISTDSTFATNVSSTSFANTYDTTQNYTVSQFNSLVLAAGGKPEQTTTVYARVEAAINAQSGAPSTSQYSSVIAITANAPYVLQLPSLYVPGDYQGWSPGGAGCASLYSATFNTQYAGYVMIPAVDPGGGTPTYQFKLTQGASFNTNWGSGDQVVGGGALLSNSGDNLQVSGAGYWLITADIGALTWSATLNNWAVIGSMSNSNWSTDLPFSFDVTNQVLVDTVTFVAGDQFQMRPNGGWTGQIGSNGSPYNASTGVQGVTTNSPSNINAPGAGKYVITLNLQVPSQPVCTILPVQ